MIFKIRTRTAEDIPAIQELMREVYKPPLHGPEAIWPEQNLLWHIQRFSEGQFVATDQGGMLIGTSTCMRVSAGKALGRHTWSEITGRGTLSTHEPNGDVIYGVNIAVRPDCQHKSVASALYAARFNLGQELGCRAFVAGARIPGYAAVASELSPEDYLEGVKAGKIFDPTLSKQVKLGFQIRGLLKGYSPDPETMDYAALIYKELYGALQGPHPHPEPPGQSMRHSVLPSSGCRL